MHLNIEKKKSRIIKHQNNCIKIASSRELLPQQKTLSQNTEELQSTGKKKPFVRKKKELANVFYKLLFFPFLHFLFYFSFPHGYSNGLLNRVLLANLLWQMLVCHQELTAFRLLPVVIQMSWYHHNWNSKPNVIQWWEENLVAINFSTMIIPATAKPVSYTCIWRTISPVSALIPAWPMQYLNSMFEEYS